MKKFSKVWILLILAMLFLIGCNDETEEMEEDRALDETEQPEEQVESESQADEETIQLAETFIENVSNGQYEEATENFDETMREQLGAADLQELWESLEEQMGEFIDYEYYQAEVVDGYEVILINGIFNDVDVIFQVTMNESQEVSGFYIQ